MPSIFLFDIYLILKITQEISERSLALFKKHGGESVKSGEEEESDEGTEDVDHPRGGVRAVLDPLHRHGHLGHRRQGGRGAGTRGHRGKLPHFIFSQLLLQDQSIFSIKVVEIHQTKSLPKGHINGSPIATEVISQYTPFLLH